MDPELVSLQRIEEAAACLLATGAIPLSLHLGLEEVRQAWSRAREMGGAAWTVSPFSRQQPEEEPAR